MNVNFNKKHNKTITEYYEKAKGELSTKRLSSSDLIFLINIRFNNNSNIVKISGLHLIFPGQLAFCKKAVEGLAARRIF